MAKKGGRPETIDDVVTVEDMLLQVGIKNDKKRRQKEKEEREKQEEALAAFVLGLQQNNIKVTEAFKAKFLRDYKKKQDRDDAIAAKKAVIEYFKEYGKQAEKERKKQDKQLERELEIAKLRASIKEDGTQKTGGQQIADNLKADLKENFDTLKDGLDDAKKGIAKNLANLGEALSGEINAVISAYSEYQAAIDTRLQGSQKTFSAIEKKLTSTLGMSPYFKTSEMLDNLNDLVAEGIAFNVEQRAFLGTISDKIATTFEVANSSLLRIVRLQQADSSAARLGMEAYLTRYLNEQFQNTEYLSNEFDSVTEALMEATATMDAQSSIGFEYQVQKWLGALSSVGMSSNAVSSIAGALGQLASGNITEVGSEMQNLLVMAASRAGLNYAGLAQGGMEADDVNQLMKHLVEYLQEIAASDNNVVRSQYASVFGMTMSDLRASINLGADDIVELSKSVMGFDSAIGELEYQLGQIDSRTSLAEKFNNMLTNIKYGIGQGIATNAGLNAIWQITDLIQSVTGGIAIPAISIMGNAIDLETTVENLIKTGIVGISALGKIGDFFTGIGNATNMGGLMDKNFGGVNSLKTLTTTGRGSGFAEYRNQLNKKTGKPLARKLSAALGTSQSSYSGQSSGGEMSEQVLADANNAAAETAEQKRQESKEKYATDIYNYLVDLFDPKLNSIVQMVGAIAGYNVHASAWGDNDSSLLMDKFEYGTAIAVSQAVERPYTQKKLDEISDSVNAIKRILADGTIKVSIDNLSSLLGYGTGLLPGGLTA